MKVFTEAPGFDGCEWRVEADPADGTADLTLIGPRGDHLLNVAGITQVELLSLRAYLDAAIEALEECPCCRDQGGEACIECLTLKGA